MFMWGWDWGWLGGFEVFSLFWVFLVIFVIPWVFFLLNLRGLLWRVSPSNRAMPPEYVWLNLIPVFNLGWFIYTVAKVSESLRAEYASRCWEPYGDFGHNAGIAAGVLGICSAIFGWVPLLGWGATIAALVCWIIYWMKTADFRQRLGGGQAGAWYGAGSAPYSGYAPYCPPPGGFTGEQPSDRSWPAGQPWPSDQQPPSGGAQPGAEQRWSPPPGTPDQVKRCAVCGTTIAPEDRFCRGCGLPLPR